MSGVESFAKELEVALALVHLAGAEVMRQYESFTAIADAPADITTNADRQSQEIILRGLRRDFPNDALRGEEKTATLAEAPADAARMWIVDPIDGTRGFARKNDEFSIMLALVENGVVRVGAVYEPAIDRVTYAHSGGGCFVRQPFDAAPRPCRVSGTSILANATLSMSRSQKKEGKDRLLAAFAAKDAVSTYSAGIKLAQVARGETDLYLGDYLTLKDWDVAAGHVLVTCAGGRISNLDGRPIEYNGSGQSLAGKGILATNGSLHQAALAVVGDPKTRTELFQ